MAAEKIATCCYCGTRAALVLRGKDRHELACSNCGAPLHNLKMLPKRALAGESGAGSVTGAPRYEARPDPRPVHPKQPHPKPRKSKKSKKRKGLFRKFMEEAFDVIEDIID